MRNKRGKLDYINFICGSTNMNYVCAMNNIVRISEVSPGFYNCRNCVLVDTVSREYRLSFDKKGCIKRVSINEK